MVVTYEDGTEAYPGVVFDEGFRVMTANKPIASLQFYIPSTEPEGAYIKLKNLQFEIGSEATAYEPYCGETFTPNPDGSVSGVTSVYPTMTLTTDKSNVTIDCEYNRDTNVVIQDILSAIQFLGEML